jgi:signal transduction histidine kinase
MLSAVFNQIGYNLPTETEPDKSIIIDNQDKEYGVFYVKDATENKLVPKQVEFVEPYGIKSVIGFGGRYGSNNIYAIILFFRVNISKQTAELFPSLNPAIKFLTLRHEMIGSIFNSNELIDSKIERPSAALRETYDKNNFQNIEYEIRTEEAVAMANELKMANISLTKMAEELNKKNIELMEEISVRKLMEEALVQSEKMKSLGIVTAGISHEFNNLLAVIIGCAELHDGNFDDDQELQKILNTIIKAGDDRSAIVKNMLLYAESHKKDTSDYLSFDIRYVLGEAIDFSKPRWNTMAQAQGIDYQIDREGMREIPKSLCSPTELRGVLQILLIMLWMPCRMVVVLRLVHQVIRIRYLSVSLILV